MLKCTNDIMSVLIYITPQKPRQVQFLSRLKSTAPAAAQVSVAWGSSHVKSLKHGFIDGLSSSTELIM